MNRWNKRFPSLQLLGLAALLACTVQVRADDFPSRPVTLVTPYQAGGSSDGIARAMALVAARDLGQPVIVESKPGAEGGTIVGIAETAAIPLRSSFWTACNWE